MGLDMYLSRKTFVKNYEFMGSDRRHAITIVGPEAENIDVSKISYIVEEVCSWRKANAIHRWFVQNVQDGVDECQEAFIPDGKLDELLGILKDVIVNRDKAPEALPTEHGFFFGDTEYDEYYYDDIQRTIDVLDALPRWTGKEFKGAENYKGQIRGDYYYQSSW